MNVKIDGLADAVAEVLEDYGEQLNDDIKVDVEAVAAQCVKDVKQNARAAFPASRKYYKDWKATKTDETPFGVVVTVHSPRHYMLAHLLEHGHAKRTGGRVEGRPHIGPAEEKARESLMQKIKIKISK